MEENQLYKLLQQHVPCFTENMESFNKKVIGGFYHRMFIRALKKHKYFNMSMCNALNKHFFLCAWFNLPTAIAHYKFFPILVKKTYIDLIFPMFIRQMTHHIFQYYMMKNEKPKFNSDDFVLLLNGDDVMCENMKKNIINGEFTFCLHKLLKEPMWRTMEIISYKRLNMWYLR